MLNNDLVKSKMHSDTNAFCTIPRRVMVVAPHPDDETLGCGGTLFKLKSQGCQLFWLIVTAMSSEMGFSPEEIARRDAEISRASALYCFDQTIQMGIAAAAVDAIPMGKLVEQFSKTLKEIVPDTIFLPFCNDVHTDHYYTAKAVLSCCKWFRHPSIKHILYYETISETDFNINSVDNKMSLNVYVDISDFFEKKKEALNIFESELGSHPFPRSIDAVESLATLRGAQCGANRAESFQLLRGCF